MNIGRLQYLTSLAFIVLLLSGFIAKSQEYPIYITDEGHMVVEVNLVDTIKGNFILDTGAGVNVLSTSMFDKVKKYAEKAGYFTGFRHDGDRLNGELFTIPSMSVGEFIQNNPIVGIYPPLDDFGIDGLLSLKFFEDQPFTIDFKQSKLVLAKEVAQDIQADGSFTLPISVKQHADILLDIFIPIRLNDEITMLAEFDTGSGYGAFIVNPGYVKELELDTASAVAQPYVTQLSGEKRTDYIYTLNSIMIGEGSASLRKENVRTIFREGLIYNALMGSGMFRDMKITIDIPNRIFVVHP